MTRVVVRRRSVQIRPAASDARRHSPDNAPVGPPRSSEWTRVTAQEAKELRREDRVKEIIIDPEDRMAPLRAEGYNPRWFPTNPLEPRIALFTHFYDMLPREVEVVYESGRRELHWVDTAGRPSPSMRPTRAVVDVRLPESPGEDRP